MELTDGAMLQGRVISQDDTQVIIDTGGTQLTLPRARIREIRIEKSEERVLDKGVQLVEEGKLNQAYDFYHLVLQKNPNDAEMRKSLEQVRDSIIQKLDQKYSRGIHMEEYDDLIADLSAQIDGQDPLPPSLRLLREYLGPYYTKSAEQAYRNGSYEKARDHALKAIEINPDQLKLHAMLTKLYYDNFQDTESAEKHIDIVCQNPNVGEDALLMQLAIKLELNHIQEAIETTRRISQLPREEQRQVEYRRRFRKTFYNQALRLEKQKRIDEALVAFEYWLSTFEEPDKQVLEIAAEFYERNGFEDKMRAVRRDLSAEQKVGLLFQMLSEAEGSAPAESGDKKPLTREVRLAMQGFIITDDPAQAARMAEGAGKLILLFLHTPTSPDSDTFRITHLRDEELRKMLGKRCVVLQLDLDSDTGRNAALHYNLTRRPGLALLNAKGVKLTDVEFDPSPQGFTDKLFALPYFNSAPGNQ
ncbi:hypothetical protein JXA32_13285 [Candidatus Sumerlaeota bacterium]|nr:hypothetical protein [Candidatus Sumerlaeota bacterium]